MRPPSLWDRLLSWVIYEAERLRVAAARFRYRNLGGRCYACPGRYGAHKFSCSVGARETDLQR